VDRAASVTVRAFDAKGQQFELDAEGVLAVCVQHEMDHLEGKLFVDYLSELKRERLKKKAVKKAKRASQEVDSPARDSVPII
jgi:peptide deformylase